MPITQQISYSLVILLIANLGVVLWIFWGGTQADKMLTNRMAIQEGIAQYAYRWDAKDSESFADLFTEDTVVERYVLDELKSSIEGRSELLEYARKSHQGRLADRQTRHHMSSIVFLELSSDYAVTENLVVITHQTAASGSPEVAGSGVYKMMWRRTEAGWQIAKRILYSDRVPSGQ